MGSLRGKEVYKELRYRMIDVSHVGGEMERIRFYDAEDGRKSWSGKGDRVDGVGVMVKNEMVEVKSVITIVMEVVLLCEENVVRLT